MIKRSLVFLLLMAFGHSAFAEFNYSYFGIGIVQSSKNGVSGTGEGVYFSSDVTHSVNVIASYTDTKLKSSEFYFGTASTYTTAIGLGYHLTWSESTDAYLELTSVDGSLTGVGVTVGFRYLVESGDESDFWVSNTFAETDTITSVGMRYLSRISESQTHFGVGFGLQERGGSSVSLLLHQFF